MHLTALKENPIFLLNIFNLQTKIIYPATNINYKIVHIAGVGIMAINMLLAVFIYSFTTNPNTTQTASQFLNQCVVLCERGGFRQI